MLSTLSLGSIEHLESQPYRVIEPLPKRQRPSTYINSFSLGLQNPTLSFINRPLQIGYLLNGVHEFVLGPYTQNQDLGLPQKTLEAEFYVVDLEAS